MHSLHLLLVSHPILYGGGNSDDPSHNGWCPIIVHLTIRECDFNLRFYRGPNLWGTINTCISLCHFLFFQEIRRVTFADFDGFIYRFASVLTKMLEKKGECVTVHLVFIHDKIRPRSLFFIFLDVLTKTLQNVNLVLLMHYYYRLLLTSYQQ